MNNFFLETKPATQVLFESTDHLKLPGLLFEPEKKTDRILLYLHGCGSSDIFYSGERNQIFAEKLNSTGISYFPFNNRGAHFIKTLDQQTLEGEIEHTLGTTFEKIKDCTQDIDGALNYLMSKGYREFYLYGHSTGANKVVVYNYYKPKNRIAKYILAGGGDDTGLFYREIGSKEKFLRFLEIAKEKMMKGEGERLVPEEMAGFWLSYQSFYDICNPNGDYNIFPFYEKAENLTLANKELFREFKALTKPTLVIYGELDKFTYPNAQKALETLKQHKNLNLNSELRFELIKGADHGFSEHLSELTELVTNWLTE